MQAVGMDISTEAIGTVSMVALKAGMDLADATEKVAVLDMQV
jgi:hypothetical protein